MKFRCLPLAALASAGLLAYGLAAPAGAHGLRAAAHPAPNRLAVLKDSSSHLSTRLQELTSPMLASKSSAAQAEALSLPASGAGSLNSLPDGKLIVTIRVAHTSHAILSRLRTAGAGILDVSKAYHVVTASVSLNQLRLVAAQTGVQYVNEVLRPQVGGSVSTSAVPSVATGPLADRRAKCDTTISEGDSILKASNARTKYKVNGTGQIVGVISDSFNTNPKTPDTMAKDIKSDNLPGKANKCGHKAATSVLSDYPGGTDEGRAMAQTVHDLAPNAAIDFASGQRSIFAFADAIRGLAAAGATVISDDLIYYDEPMYQQGPVSVAIDDVRKQGVLEFTAATNDNFTVGGKEVGTYEATKGYRPANCPHFQGNGFTQAAYLNCHNFKPTSGAAVPFDTFHVKAGYPLNIDMQWAEPWGGVNDDIDMLLLDSNGNVIADSVNSNDQTGEPFEFVSWTNNSGSTANVRLVIAKYSGSGKPRFKFVIAEDGYQPLASKPQWSTSKNGDVIGGSEIFGHPGDSSAISVAAASYNDPSEPDAYSSSGPGSVSLFAPVEGYLVSKRLAKPATHARPTITGIDCVQNTFFGQFDGQHWRFCGTSDASPHLAAIAALIQQAVPKATNAKVVSALTKTAVNISGGKNLVGAGRANALAAIAKLK